MAVAFVRTVGKIHMIVAPDPHGLFVEHKIAAQHLQVVVAANLHIAFQRPADDAAGIGQSHAEFPGEPHIRRVADDRDRVFIRLAAFGNIDHREGREAGGFIFLQGIPFLEIDESFFRADDVFGFGRPRLGG